MNGRRKNLGWWIGCGAAVIAARPLPSRACAACFGQSDSAMAAGMNWGILSLLVMILLMLGGVAGFFVFIARRSTRLGTAVNSPDAALGDDGGSPSRSRSARWSASASGLAYPREDCAPSQVRIGRKSPLNQRLS
jgi:hypothetical protein